MLVPSHFCDIQITKETNGIGVHIPLLLLNIYVQTWNIWFAWNEVAVSEYSSDQDIVCAFLETSLLLEITF